MDLTFVIFKYKLTFLLLFHKSYTWLSDSKTYLKQLQLMGKHKSIQDVCFLSSLILLCGM
jgi:hypothetical protein